VLPQESKEEEQPSIIITQEDSMIQNPLLDFKDYLLSPVVVKKNHPATSLRVSSHDHSYKAKTPTTLPTGKLNLT
jgi:hypothetical protein